MRIVRGRKRFLTPKIMAVVDRFHISLRSTVFILEIVAGSLGHNIDELAINRNTIQRYREDFCKTKANRIKELFKQNEPSFVCVHSNGTALNVRDLKSERLPIIVTYKDEEKLLGVPKLENSSGKEQAMVVWNVLKDWGLEDKAQILYSDTTSSNTGRINGAITFLELYADREMTYFPCRHHIYELVLRSVFKYELNEVTSSPDVAFFKKTREKWNNVEKENYMDEYGYKYLNTICRESEILSNVNYLSNALKNKKMKNDYRELVELCIVFIGRNSDSTIKIGPPGALHHARWMAKAIYSFKIFLFRQQLSLKMSEVNGLKNICLFLVTVYVKS
ncbi:hypothetical protein AVEN_115748-1 [Araneus ventricosus]|uniref:DUF659 domain-containing protein n=1 Tax=Araneus ventricosus TaxID=182803 RepID=A0A4Y2UCG9_ARAVE|nr:hypothetical protein AVEN_115748-1 [Araneus ventricosus]